MPTGEEIDETRRATAAHRPKLDLLTVAIFDHLRGRIWKNIHVLKPYLLTSNIVFYLRNKHLAHTVPIRVSSAA